MWWRSRSGGSNVDCLTLALRATQSLKALEFDEPGHRRPQIIPEIERLERRDPGNRQGFDQGIGPGVVEERDREPLVAVPKHPMLGRLDLAAGPALQQPAEIHRQRAFLR